MFVLVVVRVCMCVCACGSPGVHVVVVRVCMCVSACGSPGVHVCECFIYQSDEQTRAEGVSVFNGVRVLVPKFTTLKHACI